MTQNGNGGKAAPGVAQLRRLVLPELKLSKSRPRDPLEFERWTAYFHVRHRRRIVGDWHKDHPKPAQRLVHKLKRDLYSYLLRLNQCGGINKLKRFVRHRDGSRWAGHAESDVAWVIRLAETDANNPLLNKSQRYRARLEMELAAQQNIDPRLLAAFLRDAGDMAAIRSALKKAKPLSWARKYVLRRPLVDNRAWS